MLTTCYNRLNETILTSGQNTGLAVRTLFLEGKALSNTFIFFSRLFLWATKQVLKAPAEHMFIAL